MLITKKMIAVGILALIASSGVLSATVVAVSKDGEKFFRVTENSPRKARKEALEYCTEVKGKGCTVFHQTEGEGGYGIIVRNHKNKVIVFSDMPTRVHARGRAAQECFGGSLRQLRKVEGGCEKVLEWFDPHNYMGWNLDTSDGRAIDYWHDLEEDAGLVK